LDVLRTHPLAVIGTEVYDNSYHIPPAELLDHDLPAAELRHWVQHLAERKRAEEELQESKRQLENSERFITNILGSIPTSLVVIDRALRIVSVNRNFLEKTRREEQATLSRKVEEVFPKVLLKYTRLDEKVQEIFRTGKPVEGGKFAYRAPSLPTRTYYYRLIPPLPLPSSWRGRGRGRERNAVDGRHHRTGEAGGGGAAGRTAPGQRGGQCL